MRIISGRYKGKRIHAPKFLSARPTTDMAKEALFNILNNNFYLTECQVLDLFAGTGNISFEFASRGAPNITAVDSDAKSVGFIKKMALSLSFPIESFKSDVFKFLERTPGTYDIIFADPPYNIPMSSFEALVQIVFSRDLLNEDGLLVIEHSKHSDLSHMEEFNESRRYGGSVFSFFRKQNE